MIKNTLLLNVLLFSTVIVVNASESLLEKDRYFENYSILSKTPDYFWNEKKNIVLDEWDSKTCSMNKGGFQAKGSAGLIPYIPHENEIYLLFSRETWGADSKCYGELGGAVEAYGDNENSQPVVNTYLKTLQNESKEESGNLYDFDIDYILENSYTISHTYKNEGDFYGFTSVLAFLKVKEFYNSEKFETASKRIAEELKEKKLCPWSYMEKDDYQWIPKSSFLNFLQSNYDSEKPEGLLTNIFEKEIKMRFRPHLLEMISREDNLKVLNQAK